MPIVKDANAFASEWIAAWNSHNLERILAHYAPGVSLTSPVAREIIGDPYGTVVGIEALRNYFEMGLKAYPNLKFHLLDVLKGLSSVVLYYQNQKGTKTAEFMEFDADGKVVRVVANYSV
jgi:predicted ester cyclase